MPWSNAFKNALTNSADNHYEMKFRLIIGTTQFPTMHLGAYDKPDYGTNHIVEITSHNDPRGYTTESGSYYHVHGLTEQISFGGQSISPRSWSYQMQTLSVGVTNIAASQVLICKPGVLARLEISIDDSAYETIFIGQYMNMNWSGGATTRLEFQDALSYLMSRNNEQMELPSGFASLRTSDHFMWFKKVDDSVTTRLPFVPGNPLDTVWFTADGWRGATNDVNVNAFRYQERARDAFTVREADRLYRAHDDGGDGNRFALVTPTAGNKYILRYEYPNSSTSSAYLAGDHNDKLFGYGIPNASTSGTGSKIQPAFVIYGNPVCELVNCFYINGYSENMVCGLFGTPGAGRGSPYIDWENLERTANSWAVLWQEATGTTNGAPMRSVQLKPKTNGFSHLCTLFAKFGIFPRWKNGAYSVGCALNPETMFDKDGFMPKILRDFQIASIDWDLCDSGARSIYSYVKFETSDVDEHGINEMRQMQPRTAPVVCSLTVNNSDVAAGEEQAERFAKFYGREQFQPWWGVAPPARCTVVLAGLHHADIGLGDLVQIESPRAVESGVGGNNHRFHGPMIKKRFRLPDGSWSETSFISVVDYRAGRSSAYPHVGLVVGTRTDWLNATVNLEILFPRGHYELSAAGTFETVTES